MKKVLIVSTVGLGYEGITSVIISYLQAMNLDGLDIYVAGTIDIREGIKRTLEDLGCNVIIFPNRKTNTMKYLFSMINYIKKNKIEVIHAHGNSGTLAIEMVAAWFGGCKKRIAHSHSTKCDNLYADKLLRPVFNIFYTDGLACCDAAGKWLFGDRKFEVLKNGRNIEKYRFDQEKRETIRKLFGIKDEMVIGHVGGFLEPKNHRFLVEIYREIKKIKPDCKFFMIGDGPLKSDIEEMCKDLDVIFTGVVDNVQDYLSAMDGMLLPSLFEGFPLVAVEWQINGLPCILSDNIPTECIFMKYCESSSINTVAYEWAVQILALIENNNREINSNQAIIQARIRGLDIIDNASNLKRKYLQKE